MYTVYICIYGVFGGEITKYTVIYGVYVRFCPTLCTMYVLMHAHRWIIACAQMDSYKRGQIACISCMNKTHGHFHTYRIQANCLKYKTIDHFPASNPNSAHLRVGARGCSRTHTHTHAYTHIQTYKHIRTYAHSCTDTQMHTHANVQTHTHTHTHTHHAGVRQRHPHASEIFNE
jgi:hypothetical protein